MRSRLLRIVFLASGLFSLTVAVSFVFRQEWAIARWMWPDTRLSYLFIGAVAAAFGVGSLWVGWSRRFSSAVPSLVGLAVIFALSAIYLLGMGASPAGKPLAAYAALYGFAAAAGAALVPLVIRAGPGEDPPLPRLVRWSCALFAVALALAGAGLVARLDVFPWPLSPQSATLFGFAFLGLSLVYGMTAARGGQGAGVIAMSGFLTYDIVLLPPFIGFLQSVAPDRLFSLVVYIAVLIYSAAVAIGFLLSLQRGSRTASVAPV